MSGTLLIYNGLSSDLYKVSIPVVEENRKIVELADRYDFGYCDPSEELTADDLNELLNSDKPYQLVDVRTKEEYKNYHLEGSVNMPISRFQEQLKELDSGKPVCLICQSGIRSIQGLQILKGAGFKGSSYHLKGGLNQYKLFNS